jgi:hypothetical protein
MASRVIRMPGNYATDAKSPSLLSNCSWICEPGALPPPELEYDSKLSGRWAISPGTDFAVRDLEEERDRAPATD